MAELTTTKAKDLIRATLTTKGRDGFMDEQDYLDAITDYLDVDEAEVDPEDIQLVRDLLDRAKTTITFTR